MPGTPFGIRWKGRVVSVDLLSFRIVEAVPGVVGVKGLNDSIGDALPDELLVRDLAGWGTAHELRTLEARSVHVGVRQHQVLGARLAQNRNTTRLCSADLFYGFLGREVQDQDLRAHCFSQSNDAVHRLTL